MLVNIDGLYDVADELYKSFKYADNAHDCYINSDIPQDFKYNRNLQKVKNNIDIIRQQLKNHQGTISQKRASYITAEKKNLELIIRLEDKINKILISLSINNAYQNGIMQNLNLSELNVQQMDTTTVQPMLQQLGLVLDNDNKIQFMINQSNEYANLQNSIVNIYNIKDVDEANKLLIIMCNNDHIKDYSTAVEKIVNHFDTNQQEFTKNFGFDMYRKNANVNVLNVELIYSDVFININSDLFIKDEKGFKIINPNLLKKDENNEIIGLKVSGLIKSNVSGIIDQYLSKKGI